MSNLFLLLQISKLDHFKQFRDPQTRWSTCVCSCGKQCCGTFLSIQLPEGQLGCPTKLVSGPSVMQWHFFMHGWGASIAVIFIPNIMKISHLVQKVKVKWNIHKHHGDIISLLLFLKAGSRLKDCVYTVGVCKVGQIWLLTEMKGVYFLYLCSFWSVILIVFRFKIKINQVW
jgi:hypothetical protein